MKPIHCIVLGLLIAGALEAQQPTEKQLANWLKRFPAADANKDGKLSLEEARDGAAELLAESVGEVVAISVD